MHTTAETHESGLPVTDWFASEVSPVRPGVYECEWMDSFILSGTYNYWTGQEWLYGFRGPVSLGMGRLFKAQHPINNPEWTLLRWRGVAREVW